MLVGGGKKRSAEAENKYRNNIMKSFNVSAELEKSLTVKRTLNVKQDQIIDKQNNSRIQKMTR